MAGGEPYGKYWLPITYLVLGYAAMQGLSLWAGMRPITCWWFKALLIAAVVGYRSVVYSSGQRMAERGTLQNCVSRYFKFTWDAPPILLLRGAGLWLFRIKKIKGDRP